MKCIIDNCERKKTKGGIYCFTHLKLRNKMIAHILASKSVKGFVIRNNLENYSYNGILEHYENTKNWKKLVD